MHRPGTVGTALRILPTLIMTTAALNHTVKQAVVCVFCGASEGKSSIHKAAAQQLAHALHESNTRLVYGGGTVGVMGVLADTLLKLGGTVHGIIPGPLVQYEQMHSPTSRYMSESRGRRTTTVPNMHTRKRMMAQEVMQGGPGSGFVALSGGFGTLEELMEIITWNQLGIHSMPVVIYNVNGYWNPLMDWIKKAVSNGFVAQSNAHIPVVASDPENVMRFLKEYKNATGRFKLTWGNE